MSFKLKTLIIFFIVLIANPCFAKTTNIIVNGGFRNHISSWKGNSGWADVDVTYKAVFSKKRGGLVAKINCTGFRHGAVQFVQSGIELNNNVSYIISFWAKGDIGSPLEVLLRKHGYPYSSYFSKGFNISPNWKKYSFIATPNINDSSAYFMFKYTSTGTVFLDDISMRHVYKSSRVTAVNHTNLVRNSSFEVGTDHWGSTIRSINNEDEMSVDLLGLAATQDRTHSKFGSYSLKIPSLNNTRFQLTSENIVLIPGLNYTLSLWIYSETKKIVYIGMGSGYFSARRDWLRPFKVSSGWQKYTVSINADFVNENAYFIDIEGSGKGDIWVDGVQLTNGPEVPFKPKTDIEVAFDKSIDHPIFYSGDTIRLPVHVVTYGSNSDCTIKVFSENFYGLKTPLKTLNCATTKATSQTFIISPPSDHTGYYHLIAQVMQNGHIIDVSEYAIGIVPKVSPLTGAGIIASPFGGHDRFSPGEFKTMTMLGVKWLRMHPPLGTKWSVVENTKDHFKYYDKGILLARKSGFQILGSLDKTPKWASLGSNDSRFWSYPPKNYDDWESYVYNIVSHYKGIINYWEVWNEPDSDGFLRIPGAFGSDRKPAVYVELLKRAYRAAKKANPDAVIIGGCGTGHPPTRWLKSIFDHGALSYMDIASFHFYTDGRPGDVLDTPTGVDIKEIQKLMRLKIGKTIPIWETESGVLYPKTEYNNLIEVSPSYAIPGNAAVSYLIRNYVYLLASGVDKWFYYSMFTSHRTDRREATGFFEWDGAPRPLAVAYAVLSDNLHNLTYSGIYSADKLIIARKFFDKTKVVLVVSTKLWADVVPKRISLRLNSLYSKIKVQNAMGNAISFTNKDNVLGFDVSREPVYVTLYK